MANNTHSVTRLRGNNYFRPYTTGITQHDETMATIVLYSQNVSGEQNNESDAAKNYIKTFDSYVNIPELTDNVESGEATTKASAVIPSLTLDDKNNTYYGVFNNFSLLAAAEKREQIVKVHNNFGGPWNAFFLGEKPKVFTFTGFFLDTRDYPYYQEFVVAYEKYLKGRKLIENNYKMVISYDGRVVYGYLLNLDTTLSADQQYMKSFVFTVLVQKESWVRNNIGGWNVMSNVDRLDSLRSPEDGAGLASNMDRYSSNEQKPAAGS